MTTFDDVTRLFVDGLNQINSFLPKVITKFQHADTRFGGQAEDLTDGYDVEFSGMGALTFTQAVGNNVQIASTLEEKLNEFVMASDHTNKQIQSFNSNYGGQINDFIPPSAGMVEGVEYYNLSIQDVISQLRDGTLASYYDIGGAMELGKAYMLGQLDQAKEGVWSYIQYQSSQNMSGYLDTYNKLKKRPGGDSPASPYKQMHDQQVQDENNRLQEAKIQLDQIYNNEHDAFTGWFNSVTGQIATYNDEIGWAAATGQVSVGDLLQNLIHAPNGAPVVIYMTKDGLVVEVNSINNGKSPQENALLIQKAIAEYAEINGLQNPKVTLLGYQGGTSIVQELAKDKNSFQVTNVVLIGGKITEMPQVGVNYYDYVAPGDDNAGTGGASFGNSPGDWANYGVDAGEIALGATGGPVGVGIAAGEVIVSTGVSMATSSDKSDISGATNGGLFFQTPGHVPPGQQLGARTPTVVPDEPGESSESWKLTSHFPFVRGKNVNYAQSTFLNMMSVPDPGAPGQSLQGFEPLSVPTYYYVP